MPRRIPPHSAVPRQTHTRSRTDLTTPGCMLNLLCLPCIFPNLGTPARSQSRLATPKPSRSTSYCRVHRRCTMRLRLCRLGRGESPESLDKVRVRDTARVRPLSSCMHSGSRPSRVHVVSLDELGARVSQPLHGLCFIGERCSIFWVSVGSYGRGVGVRVRSSVPHDEMCVLCVAMRRRGKGIRTLMY